MPDIRDILPQPPWEGPPIPRGIAGDGRYRLPTKVEMDELDDYFERASSILMRWRARMRSVERAEYPKVFAAIDKAENALLPISDALTTISEELGFGIFREK